MSNKEDPLDLDCYSQLEPTGRNNMALEDRQDGDYHRSQISWERRSAHHRVIKHKLKRMRPRKQHQEFSFSSITADNVLDHMEKTVIH